MIKHCRSCGQAFETVYTWAKVCKACYVEEKKAEKIELEEALLYWEGRAERAEKQLKNLKAERGAVNAIEPKTLKKLIQLCHPDKHGNSAMANEVTQWLISLRRQEGAMKGLGKAIKRIHKVLKVRARILTND